jgi:hypothetical protein
VIIEGEKSMVLFNILTICNQMYAELNIEALILKPGSVEELRMEDVLSLHRRDSR